MKGDNKFTIWCSDFNKTRYMASYSHALYKAVGHTS